AFSASPMPTTLWGDIRNSSRVTVRPVFLSNPLASDREKCSLKSSGGGDVPATATTHTASTRRWSAQLFSQDSIHFRDDAVESLERFAVHHPDGKWKLQAGYAERAQARPHSAAWQNPPRDKCQSTIFSHKGKLELVVVRFHRNYHIEVGLQKRSLQRCPSSAATRIQDPLHSREILNFLRRTPMFARRYDDEPFFAQWRSNY